MAIVDKKTPRLGLLLPSADNFLQDDVERLIQSFDLLDVLVVMRDQNTGKIADDQLSEVIARLDAQGKIATSALPSSVVQKGADGKIDSSVLPSIAIIDSFPVPNEASMLGLQCERGDIAIRTDLGRSFILTDLPPSKLSNWRELTSTNVTSVNGQVGAITGLAKAGVNDDITQLTALSGPLRLGGEAAGDYDAVTLKQLRAASGGAGGASMNGVMNNFIGAVEWFNGSRAKIPAGYIPADGQECSQTDPATADLYAAVAADMFASVTEALWQNSGIADSLRKGENRGAYVKQSSPGKFRVPDLNGAYADGSTPGANFLRGDGGGKFTAEIGNVGAIKYNAAPNIAGSFYTMTNNIDASNATAPFYFSGQDAGVTTASLSGHDRADRITFDASRSNTTYGRGSEVRPNSVTGVWIIRASGGFVAANTSWSVINGDTTVPANGVTAYGGAVRSVYNIAGEEAYVSQLRTKILFGTDFYSALEIKGQGGTLREVMSVNSIGSVTVPGLGGFYVGNTGEPNAIEFFNVTPNPYENTYVNMVRGHWYADRFEFGAIRDGNLHMKHVQLNINQAGNGNKYWAFKWDTSYIDTNAGVIQPGGSDRRLKDKITDITNTEGNTPRDRINRLVAREFEWLSDGRKDRGFIAQEAQAADEIYVFSGSMSGMLNLNDRALLADIVAVVQEHDKEMAEVKAELAELRGLVNLMLQK